MTLYAESSAVLAWLFGRARWRVGAAEPIRTVDAMHVAFAIVARSAAAGLAL